MKSLSVCLWVGLTIVLCTTGAYGDLPDLRPYQFEGFSAPLTFSNEPEGAEVTAIYANQGVFISYGVANFSESPTASFTVEIWNDTYNTRLYHDSWNSLEGMSARRRYYISVVFPQAGPQILRLVIDANNDVSESNENNNSYTLKMTIIDSGIIAASDLTAYQLPDWDNPVIVAHTAGTYTNQAVQREDLSFIDYGLINQGLVTADRFNVVLWDKTEGRLIHRKNIVNLDPGYYSWFEDLFWAFDTPGTHELVLLVDNFNENPQEMNEINNEYLHTVQVVDNDRSSILDEHVLSHRLPIYRQQDYGTIFEMEQGGGICTATALADILGYWDRYATPDGTHYWNLVIDGTAPLFDDFVSAPGHNEGNVYRLVRDLVMLLYQDKNSIDRTLELYSSFLGLAFNAEHYGGSKASMWNYLSAEIRGGRPAIIGVERLWSQPANHAMPVVGVRTYQGQNQVKVAINGNLSESLMWANWYGGDDVDLSAVSVYAIIPGGTPTDFIYEYSANGQANDEMGTATEIDPAGTFTFRQTHNFDVRPGGLTDDVDWIKFPAQAGKTYTIETENLGWDADTEILLRVGNQEYQDRNSGDQARASRIVWSCKQNRTAYVKVTNEYRLTGPNANYDLCITNHSTYGAGRGTHNLPYLILSARHLAALGDTPEHWDKHFKLTHDLNLNAYNATVFSMIGTAMQPFSGTLNGNGYRIDNCEMLPSGCPFGVLADSTSVYNLASSCCP